MKIVQKRLEKQKKRKRKLIIGSSVLAVAFFLSSSIAFADADMNGLITSWFNKKTEMAKASLEKALKGELESQKIRIKKDLEAKLKDASESLDKYREQEKEKRRQAIIKHADNIINNTKFSTEADKAQMKRKLDNILNESIKAMNNLKDSYKSPVETYKPTPTQEASNTDNNSENKSANNIKKNTIPSEDVTETKEETNKVDNAKENESNSINIVTGETTVPQEDNKTVIETEIETEIESKPSTDERSNLDDTATSNTSTINN
jgi:hypothetical protein